MPLFDNILANNLLMMVSLWCIATIVQHYSHVILIFSGMKQVKLSVINPCFVHLIYKCLHVLKLKCGV